ncbi:MAG TPA: hypothetical protein VF121_02950 [Thermoanaerobaculia bacterium]|nr:hypothetical protein [Thermoanaerobaculia bacterium]
MPRPAHLLLALALTAPAAAQGAPCAVDLHTLLTVHGSRHVQIRTLPGRFPPPPVQITEDLLVTQGGAATTSRVSVTLCCERSELKRFASGIAERPDLARLRDLLVAVRVGQLEDCVLENDLSTVTGVRTLGAYEVSWFGRGARRNDFTIVFADPGAAPLPPCGPEAQQLVEGLRAFADTLAADPDRLVCSTP